MYLICIFLLIKRRDTIHYFLKIYFFDMFDILDVDSLTKLYIYWYVYIESWNLAYMNVYFYYWKY